MIDLAYTAILYGDESLAEKFNELEEGMEEMAITLNISASLSVRDVEDALALIPIFKVAQASLKIANSTADMAMVVKKNIDISEIIREAFQDVDESIYKAHVELDSPIANKKIKELELQRRLGVDILAIKRGDEWIFTPKGKEKILPKDVIYLRGNSDSLLVFHKYLRKAYHNIEEAERALEAIN